MSDPIADMVLEQEAAEAAELEARSIVLARLNELLDAVSKLAAAVEMITKMERAERMSRDIEIVGRDEFDRITKIRLH